MNDSTKTDLFTATPDLKPDGLFTRAGGQIIKIHGVGSGPQDPPLGDTWWIRVDVKYDNGEISEGREYHPSHLVHDDWAGLDHMRDLSKAVMDHLHENGSFNERGDWVQNV